MVDAHQVFVIARIRPRGSRRGPRYRSLAILYDRCYHQEDSVVNAGAFIKLVMQKENAEVVREELIKFENVYTDFYRTGSPSFGNPAMPCPFTSGLLGMSWGVDVTRMHMFRGSSGFVSRRMISFNTDFSCDRDDDSVITVIDITDLDKVRYCFVSVSGRFKHRPFTAAQFVTDKNLDLWHSTNIDDYTVSEALSFLSNFELVDATTLNETWTRNIFQPYVPPSVELTSSTPQTGDDGSNHALKEEIGNVIQPLVKIVAPKAIERMISTGDTRGLATVVLLPGMESIIRDTLPKQSPFPDDAISVLCDFIAGNNDKSLINQLDLSGYDLSDDQVLSIVDRFKNVKAINLSRISRISIECIRELLCRHSTLKRLVLMNCTGIDDELVRLARVEPNLFFNIEALMNPAFLTIAPPASYPTSLTILGVESSPIFFDISGGISLPVFNASRIVPGLIDFIACSGLYEYGISTMALYTIFSSIRKEGQSWGERTVVVAPNICLDMLHAFGRGGWLILFYYNEREKAHSWSFLQFFPGSVAHSDPSSLQSGLAQYKVHNIRSFFQAMRAEDRSCEGSEEEIVRLEKLLDKLAEEKKMTPKIAYNQALPCSLMDVERIHSVLLRIIKNVDVVEHDLITRYGHL